MAVLAAAQQAAVDPFQKAGGRVIAADEPDWPAKLKAALIAPSVVVQAPPTVRAVVRDQPDRVVIHLLNLNVQRLSSFEDQVTAARDVKLAVRVPFSKIKSLSVHTADERGTSGPLKFDIKRDEIASVVTFTVPYLEVAAVAVIEAQESPGNPSK
jgi:methionine synthase II (cobalamin-independent)